MRSWKMMSLSLIMPMLRELPGVWATGKTFEDCRNELISVIEGWIALRLRLGDPIPPIGSHKITESLEPVGVV